MIALSRSATALSTQSQEPVPTSMRAVPGGLFVGVLDPEDAFVERDAMGGLREVVAVVRAANTEAVFRGFRTIQVGRRSIIKPKPG